MASALLAEVKQLFADNANEHLAGPMRSYMKNRFDFYGIKSPLRKSISKSIIQVLKNNAPHIDRKLILELWQQPQRELHYFAIDYLNTVTKHFEEEDINLLQKLITKNAWWDSVDLISSNLCGAWFKKFPEQKNQIIDRWNKNDDMWLNRSAILFQLKYYKETDTELLFRVIDIHKYSDEFFIQKAIGWSLRQYCRTDPVWVENVLKKINLRPLSIREAKKGLSFGN